MKNSLYLCTQKPMHNAKVRLKKNGNMEKIFALVENNNVMNYSFNPVDGYSEIVLTDSQKSEIQSILDSFENGMKAIRERREYRMKNYYDCFDKSFITNCMIRYKTCMKYRDCCLG